MEINETSSRGVVLKAVKADGWELEYANKNLQADREVVLAAINSHGYALEYAAEELKADSELIKISQL